MKNIFPHLISGAVGGLTVLLAGYFMWQQPVRQTPGMTENFARTVRNLNVAPAAAPVPFDFKEAAKAGMPAVVHIKAVANPVKSRRAPSSDPFSFFFGDFFGEMPFGGFGPQQGTGSGVIYSTDGYIVTNNHVVEYADEIEVTLFDNRKFSAVLTGSYPNADLAVLKIEAKDLPVLPVADSKTAQVGEWVLAIGNPFDLTSTVTAGIISAKGRDIDIIKGSAAIESFIQTDAVVNPGNSGGALVNAQGRLLGINTAISTRTGVFEGYSFAIPAEIMTDIADDIIQYGDYRRGFLGVEISDLDAEYAAELGTDITSGVVVEKLTDGGAAQYAGVLPKDIITAVNGQSVADAPQMIEMLSRAKSGDIVTLTIRRNDRIFEVSPVLREQKR